ncbi:GIY-YIG nuclease family protein [Agromyces endophyticus]|uniref:GIY-YIG nuclease family protein n=1 Tax=Agromyces sp. H17E-10 TaxID=2932244 RepID=UPI001FD372AB|nr:GIY-YIG nuclease family protein [Agromyces sp. H17E-10]UOQ90040.1 GIY-YIG nuclease family protein [Agromyces sp. H17E-10]
MYMLRCSDGTYYVGSTRNLERRLEEHSLGVVPSYTSTRRPVELVFAEEYDRIDDAYAREKQVQGWSRRKREALIRGEFGQLPGLSSRARDKR